MSRGCYLFFTLLAFTQGNNAIAQQSPEEYGRYIYTLVLNNNPELANEFVALAEYTAYIDRLNALPEHIRETIKFDASRSYAQVSKSFESECAGMLKLYRQSQKNGAVFSFEISLWQPSKNFPDIGFVDCIYTVLMPDDEDGEAQTDGFRFECIKTENGWRILDGFFTSTP